MMNGSDWQTAALQWEERMYLDKWESRYGDDDEDIEDEDVEDEDNNED